MADNSSNSVASVAIVIIVIAALAFAYYIWREGGFKSSTTNGPAKIEVNMPSSDKPAQ